ncbi:MAG: hypothetical protein ACE10K_12405, partial [Rhodothermales bacterium]
MSSKKAGLKPGGFSQQAASRGKKPDKPAGFPKNLPDRVLASLLFQGSHRGAALATGLALGRDLP